MAVFVSLVRGAGTLQALDGGSARAPFDHAQVCFWHGTSVRNLATPGFARFPIQRLYKSLRSAFMCDQFTERLQLDHARVA